MIFNRPEGTQQLSTINCKLSTKYEGEYICKKSNARWRFFWC